MRAELGEEVSWIHWIGSRSQQLAGNCLWFAVHELSSLNAVRIPRRTRGSASVQC
jgi:hypothetical protein